MFSSCSASYSCQCCLLRVVLPLGLFLPDNDGDDDKGGGNEGDGGEDGAEYWVRRNPGAPGTKVLIQDPPRDPQVIAINLKIHRSEAGRTVAVYLQGNLSIVQSQEVNLILQAVVLQMVLAHLEEERISQWKLTKKLGP